MHIPEVLDSVHAHLNSRTAYLHKILRDRRLSYAGVGGVCVYSMDSLRRMG